MKKESVRGEGNVTYLDEFRKAKEAMGEGPNALKNRRPYSVGKKVLPFEEPDFKPITDPDGLAKSGDLHPAGNTLKDRGPYPDGKRVQPAAKPTARRTALLMELPLKGRKHTKPRSYPL